MKGKKCSTCKKTTCKKCDKPMTKRQVKPKATMTKGKAGAKGKPKAKKMGIAKGY